MNGLFLVKRRSCYCWFYYYWILVLTTTTSICCCCWASSVSTHQEESNNNNDVVNNRNNPTTTSTTSVLNLPLLSPYGSYPNPFVDDVDESTNTYNITSYSFHPVILYPKQCYDKKRIFVCPHSDYTKPRIPPIKHIVTEIEAEIVRKRCKRIHRILIKKFKRWFWKYQFIHTLTYIIPLLRMKNYVGRYDEDRIGLYETNIFYNTDNSNSNNNNNNNDNANSTIDDSLLSTCSQRTVHIGIDLVGPVGAPVFAFTDGIVHSVGYNPELGDYGYVIIVKHHYNTTTTTTTTTSNNTDDNNNNNNKIIYALYGHLDNYVVLKYNNNDIIKKGQVLGYIGYVHENGGWVVPHVHFQLSINEPIIQHDMPGTVCFNDRKTALYEYPDPRYVVGALY